MPSAKAKKGTKIGMQAQRLHPGLVALAQLLARDMARRHHEKGLRGSHDPAYPSDSLPEDQT
jgi:hypothetical protein